ncbi:hypothetical protein RQP46_005466 [Phenoliferia psychrophenolica]
MCAISPHFDLPFDHVPSTNSPVSSTAGQDSGPDGASIMLADRRGSQLSNSSLSNSVSNQHRHSLSSFVSSTGGGSPRPTASSNGTTIGDLSTASMPLLRSGRDDDHRSPWTGGSSTRGASDSNSMAPSTSSRSRRVNNSSASILSDSSSVHSYPPVPRTHSQSASSDLWSTSSGTKSRREHDGYSPASRAVSTAGMLNPFAPLRKRLVRTISSKRIGVEVQLLVELVDALEHYMRLFTPNLSPDELAAGEDARVEVVNEVTLLLKELTEIAPEAQRCLAQGSYGPIANSASGGGGSGRTTSHSLRSDHMFDSGLATWWPRRLVKDCRGLLEEVGLAATASPRHSRTPALTVVAGTTSDSAAAAVESALQPTLEEDPEQATAIEIVLAGSEWDPTTRQAREPAVPPDLVALAARQEALLVEGHRRWQAFLTRSGGTT